jgi:hypothetical protein
MDPLLASIKGKARALLREGGRAGLSLSLVDACNPYCKRTHSGAGQHEAAIFPLCVPSRANSSGLGHAAIIYSSVQGPPGRNADTPTIFFICRGLVKNKQADDKYSRTEVVQNFGYPARQLYDRRFRIREYLYIK